MVQCTDRTDTASCGRRLGVMRASREAACRHPWSMASHRGDYGGANRRAPGPDYVVALRLLYEGRHARCECQVPATAIHYTTSEDSAWQAMAWHDTVKARHMSQASGQRRPTRVKQADQPTRSPVAVPLFPTRGALAANPDPGLFTQGSRFRRCLPARSCGEEEQAPCLSRANQGRSAHLPRYQSRVASCAI